MKKSLGKLRLVRLGRPVLGVLLAMATSLAVCGCTPFSEYVRNGYKVGPNYGRPPAPVAKDWIDANDVRVRKEENEPANWWTVFNDPVLDTLVCRVYQQNLTLREAGFLVLESRAKYGIAVGSLFPQDQFAKGSFTQTGLSRNVVNRSAIPQTFYSQWQFGFGLAWELDFWGRYRRAIESADADLDASVENYDDVLVTLIGDVASTYVQLRTFEQQLKYAQTNVQLQRTTLKIAQARFKGGQATELDVDQATSNLAQTEALIPQLEIDIRKANDHLCLLLGIAPENLQAMLGSRPIPVAPPDVAIGIPADLVRRRPDVRRAEREAAAQCAKIGVAEADFYPAISITGAFGWSSQSFSDLFSPGSFGGTIGPSFKWPLLNYGRILNNVRLQEASFQRLVASYQNTVLKANVEVEDGLVTFLKSQQEARFLAQSVAAAEKAVKTAIAQYQNGLVDFNRVALLEQNLVSQQSQLAQSQGQIGLGLIQTYRALGGGWQIRQTGCTPGDVPAESVPQPPRALPPAQARLGMPLSTQPTLNVEE
ncbi:MAG: efflux transporter outer membrane subunit [Planctomycetes bacterium]|nr:efflux transporter outer membrane subunit [Planctomycetota bacterium]